MNDLVFVRVEESDYMSLIGKWGQSRLYVEGMIYTYMGEMCPDYKPSDWDISCSKDKSVFFLSPRVENNLRITIRGYTFEVSPVAAGILATLFGLLHAANNTRDRQLIDRYHDLREFANMVSETMQILQVVR